MSDSSRVGIAGVIGTAGERGTLSAARDSEGAGIGGWGDEGEMGAAGDRGGRGAEGNGGNEACRGDCVWASCCGYTSRMAALKSSQVPGSGKASRVRAKVSHVGPSV